MSNLLDKIKLPQDIKNLTHEECEDLAEEIRKFLVKSVAKTGGHLASNLGVVELTIALYRVFDFPKDKLVWDVGHQSYVHKILSGRKNGFENLRKFQGMSGFPKTCESEFDCFNTGHSSTSVSAALGLARARDLSGENNNIIAVFGDGALTGGMLYEALNDAGHTKTKLILVLNDNAMSISKNVGAMSKYLRNLRAKPGYFRSKKNVEKVLSRIPICGSIMARFLRQTKRIMRNIVLPPSMFDDLGFEYIGPVDGHDLIKLTKGLEAAKASNKPVLLHIHTKKGKGYIPAEENPHLFHGVSHYENETEITDNASKQDYSAVFGKKLCELAEKNEKIAAITAAMPIGTGLNEFAERYKKRFFDVGIAEQHAVTFAAGLAMSGYVPVMAVYSSFCQRAYDQLLHDVCLQNLHAVFCIDRAGIVGADGETHHGLFDIAYLSHMPNMTVLSPSSFEQLEDMIDYAVNKHTGPIAIRYPRGNSQVEYKQKFEFGKADVLKDGNTVTVISTGRMTKTAFDVCDILEKEGISAKLVECPTVFPVDKKTISDAVMETKFAAVIEDHSAVGGMGSLIADALSECECRIWKFAFPDKPITHGTVEELDKHYGLDPKSIAEKIKEKVNER